MLKRRYGLLNDRGPMLDKQIRLEKWISTKDGSGDWKPTNVKYNLWAEVTRIGGSRTNLNGSTSLEQTVQFKIHFKPELKINTNWRVIYDGTRYTPFSIEKVKENRFFMIISCNGKG